MRNHAMVIPCRFPAQLLELGTPLMSMPLSHQNMFEYQIITWFAIKDQSKEYKKLGARFHGRQPCLVFSNVFTDEHKLVALHGLDFKQHAMGSHYGITVDERFIILSCKKCSALHLFATFTGELAANLDTQPEAIDVDSDGMVAVNEEDSGVFNMYGEVENHKSSSHTYAALSDSPENIWAAGFSRYSGKRGCVIWDLKKVPNFEQFPPFGAHLLKQSLIRPIQTQSSSNHVIAQEEDEEEYMDYFSVYDPDILSSHPIPPGPKVYGRIVTSENYLGTELMLGPYDHVMFAMQRVDHDGYLRNYSYLCQVVDLTNGNLIARFHLRSRKPSEEFDMFWYDVHCVFLSKDELVLFENRLGSGKMLVQHWRIIKEKKEAVLEEELYFGQNYSDYKEQAYYVCEPGHVVAQSFVRVAETGFIVNAIDTGDLRVFWENMRRVVEHKKRHRVRFRGQPSASDNETTEGESVTVGGAGAGGTGAGTVEGPSEATNGNNSEDDGQEEDFGSEHHLNLVTDDYDDLEEAMDDLDTVLIGHRFLGDHSSDDEHSTSHLTVQRLREQNRSFHLSQELKDLSIRQFLNDMVSWSRSALLRPSLANLDTMDLFPDVYESTGLYCLNSSKNALIFQSDIRTSGMVCWANLVRCDDFHVIKKIV